MSLVSPENFFRLFKCCFNESASVLRDFFDLSVTEKKYFNSFIRFLDQNKHDIYHEWQSSTPCCFCSSFNKKSRTLEKKIFGKLFEIRDDIKCNRTRKGVNGVTLSYCFCKVIAVQSLTLEQLDITVMSYLLRFCGISNDDTKSIAEIRNKLAHQESTSAMTKDEYQALWTKLENASFSMAGKIGNGYAKLFRRNVMKIKQSDISKEEMLRLAKEFDRIKIEESNNQNTTTEEIRGMIEKCTDNLTEKIEAGKLETNQTIISESKKVLCGIADLRALLGKYFRKDDCLDSEVGIKNSSEKAQSGTEKTNKTDIGVQVDCSELNEEITISRLREQNEDEIPCPLHLKDAEHHCILLDMSADHEIFKNEETFKFAIDSLIDRIIAAGEIDTSKKKTMKITLTFKSPLTEEQTKTVCSMLSKYGQLNASNKGEDTDTTRSDAETASSSTGGYEQKSDTCIKDERFENQGEVEIKGVKKRVSFEDDEYEVSSARTLVHAGNLIFHVKVKGLPQEFGDLDSESLMSETDDSECFVEWRWFCPKSFEVDETVLKIKSKIPELRDWFEINYVSEDMSENLKVLVLQTKTHVHTFASQTSLDTAIRNFLLKTVEVCSIPTTDALSIIIDLTVLSGLRADSETYSEQDGEPELKKRKTYYDKDKDVEMSLTGEEYFLDYLKKTILVLETSVKHLTDRLKEANEIKDRLPEGAQDYFNIQQKIISIRILIHKKMEAVSSWENVLKRKTQPGLDSIDFGLDSPLLICSSCIKTKTENEVYLCKDCYKNICGVCFIRNEIRCNSLLGNQNHKMIIKARDFSELRNFIIYGDIHSIRHAKGIKCIGSNDLIVCKEINPLLLPSTVWPKICPINIIGIDGRNKKSVSFSFEADSLEVIDSQTIILVKSSSSSIYIMTLTEEEPTYKTIGISDLTTGGVCFHSGKIYIGCWNAIKIIDVMGNEMGHIHISGVSEICPFNDTLYCYQKNKNTLISYDLHSNKVRSSVKVVGLKSMDTDWEGNVLLAFRNSVWKTDRTLQNIRPLLSTGGSISSICVDKNAKHLVILTAAFKEPKDSTVTIYKPKRPYIYQYFIPSVLRFK